MSQFFSRKRKDEKATSDASHTEKSTKEEKSEKKTDKGDNSSSSDSKENNKDEKETALVNDDFNLGDLLKDILQTKSCHYCGTVIPSGVSVCFSCHNVQPVAAVTFDVTGFTDYKSGKGYRIKRQIVYDQENINRGVVWKNVVFKINSQGAGILLSYDTKDEKKKNRKAYIDGLQAITQLGRLRQIAPSYISYGKELIDGFLEAIVEVREQMIEDAKKLVESGDIVYEALWFIFERGTPIYYNEPGSGCVFGTVITSWEYIGGIFPAFSLSGSVMKSDGTAFFQETCHTTIRSFSGLMKIYELPVQKLTKQVHEFLTARGKQFAQLSLGAHFRENLGPLLVEGIFGYMKFRADGRVMLDISTYNRQHPNVSKFVNPNTNLLAGNVGQNYNQKQKHNKTTANMTFSEIKPSQYWMTYPVIPGFSFQLKKWGEFIVDNISEIIFDDKAFLQLVLPEEKKTMIKALVEEHQRSGEITTNYRVRKQEDFKDGATLPSEKDDEKRKEEAKAADINSLRKQADLIKHKGGGCIFLLHGSPGVGKTLTAEAVSEHLHIPLYQVTVGELGTEPSQLEKALQELLELAALWRASILLDEADIFLERRSKNDILRNAMVGIFLRLLEYHQGVLFLTTNRVECLDEAFSSRINIALFYPPLDNVSRKEIWKNFLLESRQDRSTEKTTKSTSTKTKRKVKKAEADEANTTGFDFDLLSTFNLNGRQIRSCVRTARAIANSEKSLLTQQHLLHTIQQFTDHNEKALAQTTTIS